MSPRSYKPTGRPTGRPAKQTGPRQHAKIQITSEVVAALAGFLGTSRNYVSNILSGRVRAGKATARIIEAFTGIPFDELRPEMKGRHPFDDEWVASLDPVTGESPPDEDEKVWDNFNPDREKFSILLDAITKNTKK